MGPHPQHHSKLPGPNSPHTYLSTKRIARSSLSAYFFSAFFSSRTFCPPPAADGPPATLQSSPRPSDCRERPPAFGGEIFSHPVWPVAIFASFQLNAGEAIPGDASSGLVTVHKHSIHPHSFGPSHSWSFEHITQTWPIRVFPGTIFKIKARMS